MEDRRCNGCGAVPEAAMIATPFRLRKHADFQRVYQASRKQFARQMSYFYLLREPGPGEETTPRVGLTVGKVMGKAHDRNRIKRRLRAAVRRHLSLLEAPVDVILHPRRTVLEVEFAVLEREIEHIFRTIQRAVERQRNRPAE